jgi:hypothetical protein
VSIKNKEFEMKIKIEVEIFDKPVYCEWIYTKCHFLDKTLDKEGNVLSDCRLFNVALMPLYIKNNSQRAEKCPACLDAIKNNKD